MEKYKNKILNFNFNDVSGKKVLKYSRIWTAISSDNISGMKAYYR